MSHFFQRGSHSYLLMCLFFLAATGSSFAQSARSLDALPNAPEPSLLSLSNAATPVDFLGQSGSPTTGRIADAKSTPEDPPETPLLTMFPHPEEARYWISGQANIIFQGRLPFHSLYEGTNSFRNSAEYKTSMVGTAYTALRRNRSVRYNTDFIFDMESAAGRGLSEALGLAGFTNLDVVRNPNLGPTPYIARYQIHQVIGLTSKTTSQEANFFAPGSTVPERRVELRIGKMTLPDFFDANSVGTDSHLQFLNWTVDNNGAWDYAADTRGYTVGGMAEYDDRTWSLRYGLLRCRLLQTASTWIGHSAGHTDTMANSSCARAGFLSTRA